MVWENFLVEALMMVFRVSYEESKKALSTWVRRQHNRKYK